MHVRAQFAALAAHHQRHLGVRLQLQEAVDDLDAGALQLVRPADIGLLVESRFQFDHRGDRFAGLGGLRQFLDDRAVLARPVERLLDRDHSRVARRLPQELHDDVEALIRMMDDDVLLADRREAIAAEIADALGKARVVGGEDEIGALVGDDQLRRVVEPEDPLGRKHVARRGIEVFTEKTAQLARHAAVDREMDHMAAAAAFECRLEQADEILGLFLDLDLAVAQHAEDALRNDGKSREQVIEKQCDHLLDRQKADAGAGEADKAVDRDRDQDQRLQAHIVAEPLELQSEPEPAIDDKREGMRRIHRERRQHREDVGHKALFEPGAVARFVEPLHYRYCPQRDPGNVSQSPPGDSCGRTDRSPGAASRSRG